MSSALNERALGDGYRARSKAAQQALVDARLSYEALRVQVSGTASCVLSSPVHGTAVGIAKDRPLLGCSISIIFVVDGN